jgi:hypothetical protein
MKRLAIVALALGLVAALPDVAYACALCMEASADGGRAFVATTAFLSLLPLGMVGGAGLWLRSKSRRSSLENDETRSVDG